MEKRLLSKIQIEKATNSYIGLANRLNKENYLVSAHQVKVRKYKILLLYFYSIPELKKGNTQAAFRTFLTKEDYITQSIKDNKWKTGSLSNLAYDYTTWHPWYQACVLVDDKSSTRIKKYLKTKGDPLQEVDTLQAKIMAERLQKKHQVIINRIDSQMKQVPELPADFTNWIEYTAMFKSRYIFYRYKSGKKLLDGYCTNCKENVAVKAPRHNKSGTCPNCGSPIYYKAIGKSQKVEDRGQAALMQKINDGFIVRYFMINKDYDDHYRNPNLYYREMTRDFYDNNGNVKSYEWARFKQTDEERWCDGQGRYGFCNAVLYEKNCNEILKDTIWRYSAIKEYATHQQEFGFNVYVYLEKYKEYPVIEYFVKLKLFKLVDQVLNYPIFYNNDIINLKGKTLKEVLNMDKVQLATAKRINGGKWEIDVIKKAAEAKLSLTDEQILYIAEHFDINEMVKITKYATVNKIIKYLKAHTSKQGNINNTFNDWIDYINNCKILQYDLKNEFVFFPKKLNEAHDRSYKLIQNNRKQLLNTAIKKISRKLKMYDWQYKDYIVKSPESADDIVNEGQILHHCVGTYVERVAKGETVILFLRQRENPDKPYYTIEVNPIKRQIKQCRGKHDVSVTAEIKKIIDKYAKEKLSSLCAI